ncbi:MAG: helix-turn-helix domain-containing protein [Lachnospiraceae bacterium]
MESADKIRRLREQTGMTRKDFSLHIGIPLRTIEDWEAGRRRPPEYIPRLIEYQLKYEELIDKKQKEEQDVEK